MSTGTEALSGGTAAETGGETAGAEAATGQAQTAATTEQSAGAEAATGQAQTAAGGDPWYKDLPADSHATIEAKGWKGPAELLESYRNIEKVMGLPAEAKAEAILVRPKADAKPEEVQAFVEKAVAHLVPENAEGYGNLGLDLKDGEALPPELEQARGWMHEAKIPSTQAPALVAAYQKSVEAAEAAFEAQSTKDMTDLATEFGDKWEDNAELGRRAFRAAKEQAGLDEAGLAAIERAIGTKAMMKLMIAQGRNLVEAPGGGAPGNTGTTNANFKVTKESAQAKITEKLSDSVFMARYNSPNIGERNKAIAEMEALQKIAAGTPDA